jgi:lipopolysaccharide export system permease protein
MFVFFMMFIFKYIDDFVGKGLDFSVLFELFFYFSLTTIPMALPLAILLSSLMTFGNMGEHFELTALKSAGMSLQKIMAPLTISTIFISIAAFYFSNNILPYTNLKAGSLLYDVRMSKPTLMFKDGVFNNGIEGFNIRVNKKEKDGKTLDGILIYDHREMVGNNVVLYAKSGTMEETADKTFLILKLNNGNSYKEVVNNSSNSKTYPLIRDKFKERIIRFDLSEFKMTRTKEELFKMNSQMLNISQLNKIIDSLNGKRILRKIAFNKQLKEIYYPKIFKLTANADTIKKEEVKTPALPKLSKIDRLNLIESATNTARSSKVYVESTMQDFEIDDYTKSKYKAEWHRKFTLSIACLVLFFIGAPLGAIIRKGGLGMPVVISIIFFIVFHILSITGEKLANEGEIDTAIGMWMATLILLPVGIFLTYKATVDSALFDLDVYLNPFKKIFVRKKEE